MAFPRSQRFVDNETCAPPPTTYHLPSVFDGNNCSAFKHCTFSHRCDQCLADRKSHAPSIQSTKSNEATSVPSCIKQAISHSSFILDDKEPYSFQKKSMSNIPRFKKSMSPKLTKPKAPSFMTRPRHSIHNCFANHPDEAETSCSMSNFNGKKRSLRRKSMKLIEEAIGKSSDNFDNNLSSFKVLLTPNLQDNKHLNVSYIIGNEGSDEVKDESDECEITTESNKGDILDRITNITDDMKESKSLSNSLVEDNDYSDGKEQPNPNLLFGSADKDILEKDDSLRMEFLNNLSDSVDAYNNKALSSEKLVEETAKKVKIEIDNAMRIQSDTEDKRDSLRSCDLSASGDNHVVLLISDEFIDDDYDSYVKDVTLKKLHNIEDADLFQICKTLIGMHMTKPVVRIDSKRKNVYKMKKSGLKRVKKNMYMDIERKTRDKSRNIWSEVEKIVRAAISDLKGEFKNEIYRNTEEQVDTLMSKLAKVLLKTEGSIERTCERATIDLINKLNKIVN